MHEHMYVFWNDWSNINETRFFWQSLIGKENLWSQALMHVNFISEYM
jgi:hypothetical protein